MKHLLEQMTFLEFRARMQEDPVIILPLGSVEIQGPCNPMGDFMLTSRLAGIVAERSGAIAAPCMPFGFAEVFRSVPGGIQLAADTFRGVLRDMVGAFLEHGLNRIVILNGHTGNNALIDLTLRDIRRTRGIIVPWLNIWQVAAAANRAAHGEAAPRALGHGSDPIGSVYEHLYPELTRRECAGHPEPGKTFLGLPTAGMANVQLGDIPVMVPINIVDHCEATVGGDPALANAEAGKVFADYIIEASCRLVAHMKTADVRDPTAPGRP